MLNGVALNNGDDLPCRGHGQDYQGEEVALMLLSACRERQIKASCWASVTKSITGLLTYLLLEITYFSSVICC